MRGGFVYCKKMKLEKIFENREQKESNLRHKFLMKELRVYNSWKYLLKKSNWRYIQKNKLITISFIRRLYYCYGDYDDYYSQFSRSVKPTISYIFEDILGSLVNSYLEARFNKKFEVKRNTTIPKRKLIPDISIYKKNSIIPSIIIELKTDLGRKRSSWSKNLNKYVKKYVSLGIPKRNFFYVVISIRNWKKDYNPKNIKKLGIDVNKSLKKEK